MFDKTKAVAKCAIALSVKRWGQKPQWMHGGDPLEDLRKSRDGLEGLPFVAVLFLRWQL